MRLPAGRAIRVTGIVQGVGFRPFVYALANALGLTGDVCNTTRGVIIHAFGEEDALLHLTRALTEQAPPLAAVDTVTTEPIPHESRDGFIILPSEEAAEKQVAITPDAAICADCRRELLDPTDRRYQYPFINCTNCGPRYSILLDVPYDRPNTTMHGFPMCGPCQAEYEDPTNRRHHAQADCCPVCGPRVWLADTKGTRLDAAHPIEDAAARLQAGEILAIKGLGGFHLACDPTNAATVQRLRERKSREEKPFALMVRNLEVAGRLVHLPGYAERLLTSPAAPILIARKRAPDPLASEVAPVNDFYGVMLPYTPLHVLLFEQGLDHLVMTSGNRSDEPIVIDNHEAVTRLAGIADAFLMHDRPIHIRQDDSVVMATKPRPTLIRRSRGHVPRGIETGTDVDGILGVGPFLKNTLAMGRGTAVFPGQHIGDLSNRLALDMFHEVRDHLQAILGIEIHTVACDLHPDYPTTRLAEDMDLPLVRVQHHFAHLVALMAEVRLYERSIGVAFDGTGFGDDGKTWGGEILAFDPHGYDRALHLEPVPLPGSDQAAREPWRMALAYLTHHGLAWEGRIHAPAAAELAAVLASDLPQPQTSSMGRLFDAVASLAGVCQQSTYEGQAPMALEGALEPTDGHYPVTVGDGMIQTGTLIESVAADVDRGEAPGIISGRFHNTVAEMIAQGARAVREAQGLDQVFLSGGCFMNAYLRAHVPPRLEQEGFRVWCHSLLPPNDGGVAAGQVLVAAHQLSAT